MVSDTELVEGKLILVLRQEVCQPLIIQCMYWRERMGLADKGLGYQDVGIVKGQEGAGRANHRTYESAFYPSDKTPKTVSPKEELHFGLMVSLVSVLWSPGLVALS